MQRTPYPFMMEKLVFGYLAHNGFCETAAVAARDLLADTVLVSRVDVEEVQRRQQARPTACAPISAAGSVAATL